MKSLTLSCASSVWLKTDQNCYVTQYDLLLYKGTCKLCSRPMSSTKIVPTYTSTDEQDLDYCGPASEVKKYTEVPAKTKYNSECWICPTTSCDNVAYHKYGTNLVTTCYTGDDPDTDSNEYNKKK